MFNKDLKGLNFTTSTQSEIPSDILQALNMLNEFVSKNPDIKLTLLGN